MIATGSAESVPANSIFPSTVISDAFETVTNGMHNPEALEQLHAAEEAEPDWVNIILAIRAFYTQDFSIMETHLDSVAEDSVPGRLKRVIFHMSGIRPAETELSRFEERLSRKVTEDSRFLNSAIEELRESIEYGEELFTETASLLIKEIRNNPAAAGSLALWSFRTCIEYGFDDEALADNILMLFGQAEGLRLIGLSLIKHEPDSALVCFTRSLIRRLVDKSVTREEAASLLRIIGALASACSNDDPVMIDISEMLSMLESELALFFSLGELSSGYTPQERISGMIRAVAGEAPGKEEPQHRADGKTSAAPKNSAKQESPKKPVPQSKAVQLELF